MSESTERSQNLPPRSYKDAAQPTASSDATPPIRPPGPGGKTGFVDHGALAGRLARAEPAGYEILKELGHGGMGVVFRAWQKSLKRPVALKMLRAGMYADSDDRLRFQAEAEAVARLQHPHIVQIHEIGEQDSLPFIVMELVEGPSLSQWLAGKPQPPRPAAELTRTLARAIHHAHQRGIIHRDLKPGNVLLGGDPGAVAGSAPVDLAACTPKITDFGLAKRLDTDSHQTQTGALLGTPSYMAPEQARGQKERISAATDVYALGAMLYELLTGRPPFLGATSLDTLEQVRTQEPLPPSRLQPKLPRDLETICLKCLEKEPSRRYASAEALVEDLHRFLQGEAILARPVSLVERTLRWARRRPTTALLIGLSILGLIGAAVAGIQHNVRVEAERARAQKNLHRSLQAIDQMLTRVADSSLRHVPQAEPVRKSLMEEAERLILELLEEYPTDPEVRLRAGGLYVRMGQMYQHLDVSTQKAARAYDEALVFLNGLAQEDPAASVPRDELAGCHYHYAALLRDRGRFDEALAYIQAAIAARQQLNAERGDARDRVQLALYLHLRGWIAHSRWSRSGKQADADAAAADYQQMRSLLAELSQGSPENRTYRQELARAEHFLGWLESDRDRAVDAVAHYARAISLREQLVKESPAHFAYLEDLGHTYNNLALLHGRRGQGNQSLELFQKAIPLWEELVIQFPSVPHFKSMTALCSNNLVWVYLRGTPHLDECLRLLRKGIKLQDEALRIKPDVDEFRMRMVFLQHNLAEVHLRRQDHVEAARVAGAGLSYNVQAAEHVVAAGYLARCIPLAEADASLPAAERSNLARQYSQQALDQLREALGNGFVDVSALRNDPSLAPLRSREDFQKLIDELERRVGLPPGL